MEWLRKLYLMHWSTHAAFVTWGAGAFTSAPTIASFAVHFFVLPLALILCIMLAHREGKLAEKRRQKATLSTT
jgi:hypothetical protein